MVYLKPEYMPEPPESCYQCKATYGSLWPACRKCSLTHMLIEGFYCHRPDWCPIYGESDVMVDPTIHSHWAISSNGYYPYCAQCKEEPKGGNMTKFCPNCGAKMDMDEEEKK